MRIIGKSARLSDWEEPVGCSSRVGQKWAGLSVLCTSYVDRIQAIGY